MNASLKVLSAITLAGSSLSVQQAQTAPMAFECFDRSSGTLVARSAADITISPALSCLPIPEQAFYPGSDPAMDDMEHMDDINGGAHGGQCRGSSSTPGGTDIGNHPWRCRPIALFGTYDRGTITTNHTEIHNGDRCPWAPSAETAMASTECIQFRGLQFGQYIQLHQRCRKQQQHRDDRLPRNQKYSANASKTKPEPSNHQRSTQSQDQTHHHTSQKENHTRPSTPFAPPHQPIPPSTPFRNPPHQPKRKPHSSNPPPSTPFAISRPNSLFIDEQRNLTQTGQANAPQAIHTQNQNQKRQYHQRTNDETHQIHL